jgi:hypothetical protein
MDMLSSFYFFLILKLLTAEQRTREYTPTRLSPREDKSNWRTVKGALKGGVAEGLAHRQIFR